ncbi:MAG: hypothetical protein FD135_64 [Comamonadaceae bacterium]|nr:MAG: hypothetical protein FD135_64 [Comamonadaceae bacterium]
MNPLPTFAAQIVPLVSQVLSPTPPQRYALALLNAHWQKTGLPEAAQFDASHVLVEALPLATPAEQPVLTGHNGQLITLRQQCALREINASYPLQADEQVTQDSFSYLTQNWEQIPAGTAVLCRQTNQATLLFVIANARFDPAAATLELMPAQALVPLSPPRPPMLLADNPAKSITADLAKKLAEQMAKEAFQGAIAQMAGGVIAGGLASAIINGLFNLIFPDKGDSVFDLYLKGLEKIVRCELAQSVVDQISGTLTSLRNELENVYGPARLSHNLQDPKDRKFLFNQLRQYESTFFIGAGGMLGTLQQKNYRMVSFPVFLLGAGMHLSILQEMANLDPSNKATDFNPLQSSYGLPKTGSVAKFAQLYADFAEATWPLIVAERKSHISYQTRVQPVYRHSVHYGYYVDDLINDERRGEIQYVQQNDKNLNYHYTAGHGPDDVMKAMASYTEARLKELEAGMPERLSVIAAWRKLVDNPLNLHLSTAS